MELRQSEDGTPELMGAAGPLKDADTYIARLERLIGQRECGWLSVRTTPVPSVSGDAADPPADSDTLLAAALERGSARRQNTTSWSHHLPAGR